jgi:hypothetical protein
MTLSQLILNILGFIFLIVFLTIGLGVIGFEKITKFLKKDEEKK